MANGSGFDRDKYYSIGQVVRLLGPPYNEFSVRRRAQAGKLPCMKLRGRNWWFPRDATDRAIARLREDEQGLTPDAGDRDALAIKMMRDGLTDGEIVVELRMTIEHVARLRRSFEGERASTRLAAAAPVNPSSPSKVRTVKKARAASPTSDDDRYWDEWMKASRARMKGASKP